MPRRIGRPGLIGTMARTAVITGTASATAGAMNRRQQAKYSAAQQEQAAQQAAFESQAQMAEMQSQLAAMQAQQQLPPAPPAPAPAPAAASGGDDLMAKLQQLAELKAAGVLDDAEFAAAKAKLLS
ncbi:SHOCT domain-containing protein [Actinotalea sp. M2MS4P-6]|uniref:SHOCT domain-containing protein n=1 Tax=Actinotalea sp. M2MS4P-6 TaxID=2983762 RepID=UPI0021E3EA1F|nr:SHOCT domain-containing protein [Actinotalea sp. M2MS4P-6]MCV2393320.1 SHOCT domain-containing protein [Actinotalea sp. M2MS4P-6]